MSQAKMIILYSSDSNPQYKKDIINVIGLPVNGTYRFRYKEKYLSSELKSLIDSPSCIDGREALIVFRTNSVVDGIDPFLVPIRHVVIDSVDDIDSTIYIFNFTVKGYPIFSKAFSEACSSLAENVKFSKQFFDGNEGIFATYDSCNLVIPEHNNAEDGINDAVRTEKARDTSEKADNTGRIIEDSEEKQQEKAWIRIIEALSKYEGFNRTFFFMTMLKLPQESKRMEMRENTQSTIEVLHYNSDYNGVHSASVHILYDPEIVVSSYGTAEKIECRYDKNVFAFIPKDIAHKTDSQITLNFVTEKEDPSSPQQEATIRIPITVKRTMKKRVWYSIITTIGALLIGLNDLLCIAPAWKPVLWVVGSLMVGSAWLIPKGE